MNEVNLMEKNYSYLKCQNCIFNDGCEKMFEECAANFLSDKASLDDYEFMHFKNCSKEEFDKLNEEQRKEFVTSVVEVYNNYKNVESNVKKNKKKSI